ncbi:MAG: homoserine dehydrogenase [Eubacteriales bacterium]|nr:homoserine dehydrogenase [Eubacteriales bacterium]
MKKVKIAILGMGTVGGGTYDILTKNIDIIMKRVGIDYEISAILERRMEVIDAHGADHALVTQDIDSILDGDTDIIVECLGGIDFPVSIMKRALENGIGVVTPNKAAVAANYDLLREAAEKGGAELRFEAAVGGGIPILTTITDQLAQNNFTEILGILNGTTNYILTKMTKEGEDYETALKEAQAKGFAEPDPTADVEGIDTANKLCILMTLAMDHYVNPRTIPTTGITGVTPEDIEAAKERDSVIKLIAKAENVDGNITYEVKPTEIPMSHPLAEVSNEFNAIYLNGDAVGELMFYGKGAGALPTGSALVADILAIMKDIAK